MDRCIFIAPNHIPFPFTLKHRSSISRWHLPSFTFHRILSRLQHCLCVKMDPQCQECVSHKFWRCVFLPWTWSVIIHFPQPSFRGSYIGSQDGSVPTVVYRMARHLSTTFLKYLWWCHFILSNIHYCVRGNRPPCGLQFVAVCPTGLYFHLA